MIAAKLVLLSSLWLAPTCGEESSLYVKTASGYAAIRELDLEKLPVIGWQVWFYRAGESPRPPSRPWGSYSAKTREEVERYMESSKRMEPLYNEILGRGRVKEPIYTHFNAIGPIALIKKPGVTPPDNRVLALLTKLSNEQERCGEILDFLQTAKKVNGPVSKILGYRKSESNSPYAGVGAAVREYAKNVEEAALQVHRMARILDTNLTRISGQIETALQEIGRDQETIRTRLGYLTNPSALEEVKVPKEVRALGRRLEAFEGSKASFVDGHPELKLVGSSIDAGGVGGPIDVSWIKPRFGVSKDIINLMAGNEWLSDSSNHDITTVGGGDDAVAVLFCQSYVDTGRESERQYAYEWADLCFRIQPDSSPVLFGTSDPERPRELKISFGSERLSSPEKVDLSIIDQRQKAFRSWVQHYASDLSRYIHSVQAALPASISSKEIAENSEQLSPLTLALQAPIGAFKSKPRQIKGGEISLGARPQPQGTMAQQKEPVKDGAGALRTQKGQPNKGSVVYSQGRSAKAIFKEIEALMPFRVLLCNFHDPKVPDAPSSNGSRFGDETARVKLYSEKSWLERDGDSCDYIEQENDSGLLSNGVLTSEIDQEGQRVWKWYKAYLEESNKRKWTFKFADLDADDIVVKPGYTRTASVDGWAGTTHLVNDEFEFASPASLGISLEDHAEVLAKMREFLKALIKHYPFGTYAVVTIGTVDDKKTITYNKAHQVNKLMICVKNEEDGKKLAKSFAELIRYYQSQSKGSE